MSPRAVLISDIHMTPQTLEASTKVLVEAFLTARRLKVPLIVAGDTLDSKAVIRAEVSNNLISLLNKYKGVDTYFLVGNHEKINNHSKDHSLNFLEPYVYLIDTPTRIPCGLYTLPYYHDNEELKAEIDKIPPESTIIMHQGVIGADLGHYIQDTSSLPPEVFANYRVISGHYHKKQDIKCGEPRKGAIGLFSYLGSPYTTSFTEANNGDKGFSILHDDGQLELCPVTTRRHRIVKAIVKDSQIQLSTPYNHKPGDFLWVKLEGPKSVLDGINKKTLGESLFGTADYKLELLPLDGVQLQIAAKQQETPSVILETLISNLTETTERKELLKTLYKDLMQ